MVDNKIIIDKIEAELEAHRKNIAAADDPEEEFQALISYIEWVDEASEYYDNVNEDVGAYFFLNVYTSDETDEYGKRFFQLYRQKAEEQST